MSERDPSRDVADVGAGTGFLTRMIARAVGPEGKVYAVEEREGQYFLEFSKR